jgi:hypothetical protein
MGYSSLFSNSRGLICDQRGVCYNRHASGNKMCRLNLNPNLKFFFTLSIWNLERGSLICIDVLVVKVVDYLATKLRGRFPTHGVIDNLGVVYPQYWL